MLINLESSLIINLTIVFKYLTKKKKKESFYVDAHMREEIYIHKTIACAGVFCEMEFSEY